MSMTAEMARAILAQADKDETREGPIPEDDAKAIEEAKELVEMAQSAWDQYVRGPEVEALLRLANEDFDGSSNGNGATPDAEAETPAPDPEPDPEPEPAEEAPAPEDPPAPAPEADGEDDLSHVEPWEGYSDEKAADIISAISAAEKEYSEDELRDLLGNMWAYESAHKNRATVINALEDVAGRLTGEEAPAEEEPEVEVPDPDEAVETEAPAEEPEEETAEPHPPVPESEPESEETPLERIKRKQAEQAEEAEPEPEEAQEPVAEAEPEDVKGEEPEEPEGDDEDYSALMKTVEEEVARERLHAPSPPQEEVEDLPWDWTRLSDAELQKFYGVYSALAYYKSTVVARENRMAVHCKNAADELHRALLISLDKYDANGKEKKVAVVEAEVESDENVKKWRRRQRKHETFAIAAKTELDSYNKIVESLSRLETMRQNEWERTGGKVGRGRSKPGS